MAGTLPQFTVTARQAVSRQLAQTDWPRQTWPPGSVKGSGLFDTFMRCKRLIGPDQRGRWLVVVAIALMVSVFEAAGTLLVFALLGLLVGDNQGATLPLVGNIERLAPGLARDELMTSLGVAVAVFFVVRGLVVIAQSYVQYRVAENAGARVSTRLLEGYLSMPYAFHLKRNSSELIRNAFDSVQRFVTDGLIPGVKLLSKFGIVAGVLAVLLWTSPLATLLAVAVLGPSLFLLLRLVHPRVQRLGRIAQDMAKQNLQALQQSLHGIRDIVVLGRERTFVDAYQLDRRMLARTRYLRRTAAEIPRVGIETGVVLFIVAFLGMTTLTGGTLTEAVPMLGLFGYAAVRIMPELNQITTGLNSLKFVGPAIDDIHDDLVLFSQERRPTADTPLALTRELTLRRVSFTYPGTAGSALAEIDVTIQAGESVGIVGPTGGGKTTLVDVILGLLEPSQGVVQVDGVDIQTRLRGWQANLGVVPQMVFLTDDTLRRNVALGVPDDEIDEDAVRDAIRLAQLEDFIAALPDGPDTYIGERGVRVSGGQRQRLAIARALYRQPNVLVFDEGTSALDNETEAALMAALEQLRTGRTVITVAHRLSTVASCDRVLLVHEGRIADTGTYHELAGRHASLRLGAV